MLLPVTLLPKSSGFLSGALSAAHVLVLLGLSTTGLPPELKLCAGLLLAVSLFAQLRAHSAHPAWSALTLLADGRLELERAGGERRDAELLAGSTVFPWLVVLLLRIEGRRLALVFPSGSLVGEGHRTLRIWLRWRGMPA